MLTPADLTPFALSAAVAAAAGMAMGFYMALPTEMAAPPVVTDSGVVSTVDPNLARYRQVMNAEGVNPTPYILAAYTPARPARVETPDDMTLALIAARQTGGGPFPPLDADGGQSAPEALPN